MIQPRYLASESLPSQVESPTPSFGIEHVDGFGVFLDRVNEKPLLTDAEVKTLGRAVLARRAASNGEGAPDHESFDEASDELVTRNMRLVLKLAREYARKSGLEVEDLVQEGTLGLFRAATKYDYRKGYRFSTYAVWWIKQAINRAIADKGRVVRLPVHVHDQINRIRDAAENLVFELKRLPSLVELSASTGLDPVVVYLAVEAATGYFPLDEDIHQADALLANLLRLSPYRDPAEEALTHVRDKLVDAVVGTLEDPSREVLIRRYGFFGYDCQTLEEVGAATGMTRERVRQIEARALEQLRHHPHSQMLADLVAESEPAPDAPAIPVRVAS